MAFLHSFTRTLRWHRRGLAALAAAIAVLAALTVLRPAPPPSRAVVVTAAAVPAGTALGAEHLRVVDLPVVALPQGAITDLGQVLGGTVVAPLARGAVLTPEALTDTGRTLPAGQVLVPFRLDDPAVVALIQVGDLVSVVGQGQRGEPVVLARRVRVAALPRPSPDSGPLGSAGDPGGLMLVQTDATIGAALAVAASAGALGVMLG